MTLATRYGLVGLCALALLSSVHWLRSHPADRGELVAYLIGVTPNFAAALAILFVALSFWADQNPKSSPSNIRKAYAIAALGTGAALVAWEFFQKTSTHLIFDTADIVATFVGLIVATATFAALSRR